MNHTMNTNTNSYELIYEFIDTSYDIKGRPKIYFNKSRTIFRNKRNENNTLIDCANCGGSGCGRCCSKNPDNILVDCANCGGSGCGRCC